MADDDHHHTDNPPPPPAQAPAAVATAPPPATKPSKPPSKPLPPWKVILHNDEVNDQLHVIETILMLTPLGKPLAIRRMFEAHRAGLALLLTTHHERAELYQQQFASRNLTVTIEKA